MRKKVIIEAMADGVVTNLQAVSHPPTNLESHIKDFHPSVKRLSQAARATAQRLHAITYLQRSPSVMTELVPEVYALAAILCDLNDDLLLGSNLKATDWTPMWTSEHHKNLTGAIDECDGALKAVFRAVQIADEESRIVAISKKANNYIEHLLAEGSHALESVVRCSRLVSKTKVIVRHTLLSQTEILNDDEIEELLRLIQALQHPDLQLIWVRKDESFASKQMQRFSIPPPTISIGPSAAETASTSSPLDRSPGSTVKPVLTPDCPLTAPQQTTEPGEVAFGEPSVINPTPSRSVFANVTSTSGFANYSKPKSNVFGPRPPHLEGYIIRPTVQTMGSTSTLSYCDEPLRLNEVALQAQLLKPGPESSVIDKLLKLHPQQVNLIQGRASNRDGDIVSVQYGRPIELQTVLGCIQVRPALYIISTTTTLPLRSGAFQQVLPTKTSLFPPGPGTGNVGGGLFDKIDEPAPPPGLSGEPQPWTSNPSSAPALNNTSHEDFQTITAKKARDESDESLEEIRVADYKAGRRYGGIGGGLFGGLGGSSGRAFPPPTAAGSSEGKWYPKPLNGDDVTFPPYRGRPGIFAGFTVDNSGDAPAFTKSNTWGVRTSAIAAPRSSWPSSGTQSLFGGQGKSLLDTRSENNPYANDKLFAANVCTIEHQHGIFCRVPPTSAVKSETASANPFGNPPVSSGSGISAFSSTKSQFEALKKTPFGTSGPQPAYHSGGQCSLNPKQNWISETATTQSNNGGLFGGRLGPSSRSHDPSASGNTLFGGAAATSQQCTQTWPQSRPNHSFPSQSGCALFAQPSYSAARLGGLFGSSNASVPVASSNPFDLPDRSTQSPKPPPRPFGGLFGNPDTTPSAPTTSSQPAPTVPHSPGTTLFSNVNSAASTFPYATSSKPVQASIVAPGTRWSGNTFENYPISRPNAVREYQQQLRYLEERKKEAMRTETLARRGPHDDAALAELIGSAKPAPIDDVISALLSDDKSEKEKEAWYKAGLATLLHSEIKGSTGAERAASSLEKREGADLWDTTTTSEECGRVNAVALGAEAGAAKASGASPTIAQPSSKQRHVFSSDDEDDFYL